MKIRFNPQIKLWEIIIGFNVIGEFETYLKARDFKLKKLEQTNGN